MKKIIILLLFCNLLSKTFYAQFVGIGTETPTAMLDVNGDLVLRTADITIDQSINLALDVNTNKSSSYRISIGGAEDIYSVGGITAGQDGRIVTFFNSNMYNSVSFYNQDPDADSTNRIITGSNENFILNSMGVVTLQYDTSVQKWIIKSNNKIANESVWGENEENIYFNEFVGIGTEDPTVPLDILTNVDEMGFSHTAGGVPITVASTVSELNGSIGTTTDNVFSLDAGGSGKLHVWPDGDVMIGEETEIEGLMGNAPSRMNPFDSKLTVLTPINETGFTHIGGDNEVVVSEDIGGVSASFGTLTNHTFRLKSNGIGRLHILEDGRVVISPNYYPPFGQLTVHTGNNTNGVVQVGGEGQQLAMRIGGSSGSIGTWTPHIMRIVANSLAVINIDPAGNVAIGTPDPLPGYKLSINGNVKAKELVIETTGWPDYVFDDQYTLRSLRDLEYYIDQHHHLPNIPSAREIEDQGLHVGDVQKKMMEKIEELTLYIISLNKEVKAMNKEIELLKISGN